MHMQRLIAIIWLLIHRRRITVQELADRFEVSTRTIYRDLDVLSAAGIPFYAQKGKGGGIRLMDDYALNKTYLTAEEQKETLAALQGFKQLIPLPDELLHKLTALFPDYDTDWLHVDFSMWHASSHSIFDQLKHAILHHQLVSIRYISNEAVLTQRLIEPYRLIFKHQSWYLYAYCRLREDFRFFKLDRINTFNVSNTCFERRTLPTYTLSMPTPKQLHCRLKIKAASGFRVMDEFPPDTYTRDDKQNFIIDTMLADESWLIGYLLSFGSDLEVLAPASLKNKLLKELTQMQKNYL